MSTQSDKTLTNSLRLLRSLPMKLKIAWTMILVGFLLLIHGFLWPSALTSLGGLLFLTAGYAASHADMRMGRTNREVASGYQLGIILAPILASVVMVPVALIFLAGFVVLGLVHGFTASGALRTLHFVGVLFALLVVTGIPKLAFRAERISKADQDGADQSSAAAESTVE